MEKQFSKIQVGEINLLTEDYKEKELENKMLERLKNVLFELGSGFSFVGNQYKVTVGNQDFLIYYSYIGII